MKNITIIALITLILGATGAKGAIWQRNDVTLDQSLRDIRTKAAFFSDNSSLGIQQLQQFIDAFTALENKLSDRIQPEEKGRAWRILLILGLASQPTTPANYQDRFDRGQRLANELTDYIHDKFTAATDTIFSNVRMEHDVYETWLRDFTTKAQQLQEPINTIIATLNTIENTPDDPLVRGLTDEEKRTIQDNAGLTHLAFDELAELLRTVPTQIPDEIAATTLYTQAREGEQAAIAKMLAEPLVTETEAERADLETQLDQLDLEAK